MSVAKKFKKDRKMELASVSENSTFSCAYLQEVAKKVDMAPVEFNTTSEAIKYYENEIRNLCSELKTSQDELLLKAEEHDGANKTLNYALDCFSTLHALRN